MDDVGLVMTCTIGSKPMSVGTGLRRRKFDGALCTLPRMWTGRRMTVSVSGSFQKKLCASMSTSMRSRMSLKFWPPRSGASSERNCGLLGCGP